MATVRGTSGKNTLIGTADDDLLLGLADDDVLVGGLGGDVLEGGKGFDIASYFQASLGVVVSLANPTTNTGEGVGDSYKSIEGLAGSKFDDILRGDNKDNWLVGNGGADQLEGYAGFDTASYQDSEIGLTASLGNPASNTGEAAGDTYLSIEALYGTRYADILSGYGGGTFVTGDNWIGGNDGNDILIGGGLGADTFDGGAGLDYVYYVDAPAGLTVSLATPGSNTGEAADDTLISIERLAGSAFNDILIGDAGNNTLRGNGGADRLDGGGGIDTASYGASPIGITVSLANAKKNTGEAAGDTYFAIEGISGSHFDDTLTGDAGHNSLLGNGGADRLDGGAGSDTASYEAAQAGLTASLASPSLNTGEAAGDTYFGIESLRGSNFNDSLKGNGSANTLYGLSGDDLLDGGADMDSLFGGVGSDTFAFTSPLAAGNIDMILDFDASNDKIALSYSIFAKAGVVGPLLAGAFQLGEAANDAGDRIIYDQTTGSLWYDVDGTGSKVAKEFARVTAGVILTPDNFMIS